jgi:hypothetical protein
LNCELIFLLWRGIHSDFRPANNEISFEDTSHFDKCISDLIGKMDYDMQMQSCGNHSSGNNLEVSGQFMRLILQMPNAKREDLVGSITHAWCRRQRNSQFGSKNKIHR